MAHKFKFRGGHQDGTELRIDGIVPQEMRIPLLGDPTKAEVYILRGDGSYHFDRFSDAPPHHENHSELDRAATAISKDMLPIIKRMAPLLQELDEVFAKHGAAVPLTIGKWHLSKD